MPLSTWFLLAVEVTEGCAAAQEGSSEVGGVDDPQLHASGFVFPPGYSCRNYTRDKLSVLEKQYLDGLELTSETERRVVLDKFDLCHQAGITQYDDYTAFIEDRASLEEILKDLAEMAEVRRKQNEAQAQFNEARRPAAALVPRECILHFVFLERIPCSACCF